MRDEHLLIVLKISFSHQKGVVIDQTRMKEPQKAISNYSLLETELYRQILISLFSKFAKEEEEKPGQRESFASLMVATEKKKHNEIIQDFRNLPYSIEAKNLLFSEITVKSTIKNKEISQIDKEAKNSEKDLYKYEENIQNEFNPREEFKDGFSSHFFEADPEVKIYNEGFRNVSGNSDVLRLESQLYDTKRSLEKSNAISTSLLNELEQPQYINLNMMSSSNIEILPINKYRIILLIVR